MPAASGDVLRARRAGPLVQVAYQSTRWKLGIAKITLNNDLNTLKHRDVFRGCIGGKMAHMSPGSRISLKSAEGLTAGRA